MRRRCNIYAHYIDVIPKNPCSNRNKMEQALKFQLFVNQLFNIFGYAFFYAFLPLKKAEPRSKKGELRAKKDEKNTFLPAIFCSILQKVEQKCKIYLCLYINMLSIESCTITLDRSLK